MTSFYQVGGSLKPDAPSYLKRHADEILYESLKLGQFCYVLNSPQIGKSSLWLQTQRRLTEEGVKCATVDLAKIGKRSSEDNWYRILFYELVKSFDLSIRNKRQAWWNERSEIPPINRLAEFVEDILLQEINGPIVICLDKIDCILSFNFSLESLLAWIRSCYNQRNTKPIYLRLTFCVLGVATISSLIQDKARNPFNIGQNISLSRFTKGEVQPLAQGLQGKVANPQQVLEEVLEWTNGQPFLTQKICNLISNSYSKLGSKSSETEINVQNFVQSRILKNWELQDNPEHIKSIRDRLLNNPSTGRRMLQVYQNILEQGKVRDESSLDQIQLQLRLTGLVVQDDGMLRVYNKIYQNIFNEAWIKKQLDKIPPYIELYEAWLNSEENISQLLSGEELQEALDWSEDKSLNEEEYRFLKLSQIEEKRKAQIQIEQEAYQAAQRILEPEFEESQRQTLISEILLWTGNQLDLNRIACQIIVNYKTDLREGQEKKSIEQLIRKYLIENWQQKDGADYLTEIQNRLLATDGDVKVRLETYKDILQSRVFADDRPEKLALQQAKLVINNNGYLEVANRIYKEVFNLQWVDQELEKIVVVENSPAPITANFSRLVLILFIILTFAWLIFKPKSNKNGEIPISSIPEICTQRDFSISLENNIQTIQTIENQSIDDFPSECKTQLTELNLIKKAIGLAVNNRVANKQNKEDAFEILCQIPETSSNFDTAKDWVKQWYEDDYWKSDIDQALQDNPQCNKLI